MQKTAETNLILTAEVVNRKLRRMAIEIAERNWDCSSLSLFGVSGNGELIAQIVMQELKQLMTCPVEYAVIHIDKQQPVEATFEVELSVDNKTIILVDDVADTGRTLFFAIKPFLSFRPASVQTLVLVERSHKLFPIQTDYVGLSIATTLKEHISVQTDGSQITGVWLH